MCFTNFRFCNKMPYTALMTIGITSEAIISPKSKFSVFR